MNKHKHGKKKRASTDSSTVEDAKLIKAEVRLAGNSHKTYEIEFAPLITADELLKALLKETNLPERNSFGEYNFWKLILRLGDVTIQLSGEEVMGDIIPGSDNVIILYVQPEMCAG